MIDDLEFAFGAFETYQIPVAQVEAITELDFGRLRDHDPLAALESANPARIVGDASDIQL
jgi:endonuclease G